MSSYFRGCPPKSSVIWHQNMTLLTPPIPAMLRRDVLSGTSRWVTQDGRISLSHWNVLYPMSSAPDPVSLMFMSILTVVTRDPSESRTPSLSNLAGVRAPLAVEMTISGWIRASEFGRLLRIRS